MRTEAELHELAVDVITGRVFATNKKEAIQDSFGMVLMFLDDATRQKLKDEKATILFASYSDASPMAVNGQPIFFSMSYLTEDEAKVFWPIFETMQKALEFTPKVEEVGS